VALGMENSKMDFD